jgi:hypothetical protein
VAAGAIGALDRRVDSFLNDETVEQGDAPLRDRLTKTGGKYRSLFWRHSLDEYRADPLHGSGAGTFRLTWEAARPPKQETDGNVVSVVDGHSLYTETLGELGWPGLALLLAALLAILARFAWLARGPDRALGAVLLAAGLAWTVHAGFDWDWEVPGVALWLFAAGGLALARPPCAEERMGSGLRWPVRVLATLGLVALAILPAQVALSQRHLDRSSTALTLEDCPRAVREARASNRALGARPEPLQIEAVCAIRAGHARAALDLIAAARRRDPNDWTRHYTEALIRASAGLDPRPAMARASRLNPYDPFTLQAVERLDTGSRRAWRRLGPRLPLPPG